MERLLVAEGDAAVRSFLNKLLLGAGYHVTAVADGEAALAALLHSPPQFVAAVLGQGLSRLTGTELVARLRCVYPNFPVLLLSGRCEPPVDRLTRFLAKPFPPDTLVEEVTRLTHPPTSP